MSYDDEPRCEKCGKDYYLDEGHEATRFCHGCAHELAEGNAQLLADLAACRSKLAVLDGTACAEEQAGGDGPCGACKTCLRQDLAAAREECGRLAGVIRLALRTIEGTLVENAIVDIERPEETLRQMLEQALAAAGRAGVET